MSSLSQYTECNAEGDFVVQLNYPIAARFRYRSWHSGFGCERWEAGLWHAEDSDFGLPLLATAATLPIDDPLVHFVQAIPTYIRQQVQCYSYNQALLLRWLARNVNAQQLFSHSPQLCWFFVCYCNEQQWSEAFAADVLTRSRVQILFAITGINSKALVNLLARVQLNKGNGQEYHLLCHFFMHVARLKPLMHWRQIPIQALWACRKYPALIRSRCLKNQAFKASSSTSQLQGMMGEQHRYWQDVLNMARLLDINDAQITLERCADFTEVKSLHDRWIDKINQRSALITGGNTLFPTPPLAGNTDIFPILSMEDLQEEGRLMHHCVASYYAQVMAGKCYIYRMLRPERVTIEVRVRADKVDVGQVALAYNHHPQATTRHLIHAWLMQGIANQQTNQALQA